jgi:hypothetical protein
LNEAAGGSACHAWSAHPCFSLVELLAGIRQAAVAWSRIAVQTRFTRPASIPLPPRIPSPRARLNWNGGGMARRITGTLLVPAGVEVELDAGGAESPFTTAPPPPSAGEPYREPHGVSGPPADAAERKKDEINQSQETGET